MRVGVISDTHGFFDSRVLAHFADVEHIIHAGDIGNELILRRLQALAPVTAVTGNVDWGGPLDREYGRSISMDLSGCRIYVTHIGNAPKKLILHLPEPRPDVFVYGHSHIPVLEHIEGVLFLNPGAAGKPRFGRVPSIAILELAAAPMAKLVML